MTKNSDPKMLLAKVFGTVVIWGCVAGLSFTFHVVGAFGNAGAFGITIVAILLSIFVWDY